MIFLECQIPFANGGKEGHATGKVWRERGRKRSGGAGRGEEDDKGPSEGDIRLFDDFFKGFVIACGCFISAVR